MKKLLLLLLFIPPVSFGQEMKESFQTENGEFEESLEKLIAYCNEFDNRIDPSNLNYNVITESLINLSSKFNFEWNRKVLIDDNGTAVPFS